MDSEQTIFVMLSDEIDSLRAELEQERQERMQLAKTVEGLQNLLIKAGEYKGRAPRERRLP